MSSYPLIETSRIPLSKIFGLILLIIILFSSSRWEDVPLAGDLIFLIGCVLVGIGSLGRLWCSLYISGYKNDTLVTCGPYSISRNPLYFFSIIGGVGVGLATETLMIPLIIVVLFLIYYPSVIKSEEKRLLSIHGEEFKRYCDKTPSFIPKLSLFEEPEEYIVNPRIFRKNIIRAIWFIWFFGIMGIIEAFHETGILPIYFRIY
jgi:protein-S-isoprenylcysteine O-methyltransferase Ste14